MPQDTSLSPQPALSGFQPALVGSQPALVGSQPALVGSQPALVGSQPTLVGSQPALVGFQPVLLGFLVPGPRHGYELHQEFSHELGRVWRIGRSQLYAQLKQLAESGWVTVRTEAQSNRPPRKVYHLTLAGQEAFLDWLRQTTPHLRHIRLEFLTRLYFFRRLSLPGLEGLVASQKALLQSCVESLSRAAAQADDDFWQLVLEFRRGQMEAVIRWLDRCLETQ